MSGGFGFGGGGFQFGTSNPQTTQTGSMFGMNPAASSTQPTTTSGGGFSFGSSGFGGNVSLAGFSFPGANTATTTAGVTAASGGLSFGLGQSSLTATKPSGLNFGGSTASSGFSLAGQPAVTTSVTTATATGSMFGFSSGLGGSTAAATTTAPLQLSFGGTVAPTLGGLGATSAATTISATAQPSLGGFKLSGALASAATTPASTSLLGGLLAGSKPSTVPAGSSFATPSTQPASTTTVASTGFNLGGVSSLSAGPTITAATTSSSLVSTAGFGLSSSSLPAATSTAPNSGFCLAFTGGTTSVPAPTPVVQAAATTSTSAGGGAVSTAPSMNYRQLEDTINKWTQELEEQEAVFLDQATQVNAWDRLLIENGDMIMQLSSDVEKVKTDEQRLDQELDFILGQQSELEDMLKPLELALEQLPPITYQQHADLEREHTYKLAENVDSQLKRMASDLKEIVEHLNSGTSTQDNTDPLIQIARILNAHVDSLQWIDQKTGVLQRRVEDVARQASVQRRQQQTYR